MNPERREFELRDYAIILLRRKWWVILAFLSVTTSAGFYVLSQEPIYEASARIQINTDWKSVGQGASATWIEGQDMDTQLEILRSPGLIGKAVEEVSRKIKPVRLLGTAIAQVGKTNIVAISVKSTNPEVAAATANALADAYIERSLEMNKRSTTQSLQYIGEQISVAQHELDEAETGLRVYKEKTGMIDADSATSGGAGKVGALQEQIAGLDVGLRATEAELSQIDRQRREAKPTVVSERAQSANPVVQELKSKLLALEMQRLQLLDQYNEGSRRITEIDSQISTLKQRLVKEVERVVTGEVTAANPLVEQLDKQKSTLEAERIASQARRAAIASRLPLAKAQLATLPARQVEFNRLTRRVKVAEATYTNLLTKQQDLMITQGSEVANAAIASYATAPRVSIGPHIKQTVMSAAVLGLVLGLVLAMIIDYLDDSIKDPKEAEDQLGLPVLGVISLVAGGTPLLADNPSSRSPLAEAFRTLRANLRFSSTDKPIRTVLVTSPGPGEGKSTTAAGLAIAAANAGQKVILVDTDLRRPSVHKLFNIAPEYGLTDVLTGNKSVDEALVYLETTGVSVMTTGPLPPNPIELLESEAMTRVIAALEERADLVIFDSPPLLVVADSQILSTQIDGTLLVLAMNSSRREMCRHAKEILTRINARILGVVGNKVRRTGGRYYYYYYYYHYYGESGKKKASSSRDKDVV
ncbi:MAG: polysaccharide biosynthesis tyrosine autokinase [Armatimonadota bacterium]